jgi:hypothetical protein
MNMTTANNKKDIENPKKKIIKLAGIKAQKDGGLTRPDEVYDVQVADLIVEIDRSFLSQLTNKDAADMVKEGMDICKDQLKLNGLKVLSSHMQSNPPEDTPHILLSIVADKRLSDIVDNINKVVKD